jgi:hypothetical protein
MSEHTLTCVEANPKQSLRTAALRLAYLAGYQQGVSDQAGSPEDVACGLGEYRADGWLEQSDPERPSVNPLTPP